MCSSVCLDNLSVPSRVLDQQETVRPSLTLLEKKEVIPPSRRPRHKLQTLDNVRVSSAVRENLCNLMKVEVIFLNKRFCQTREQETESLCVLHTAQHQKICLIQHVSPRLVSGSARRAQDQDQPGVLRLSQVCSGSVGWFQSG